MWYGQMTTGKMKTPERWRALPRCPLLSVLLPHRPSNTDISHIATANVCTKGCGAFSMVIVRISKKHLQPVKEKPQSDFRAFQNLGSEHSIEGAPASLYNLIQKCPRSFWVRTSNGSVVRALTEGQTDKRTDRQTGPILYPRPLTQEGKMQMTAPLLLL